MRNLSRRITVGFAAAVGASLCGCGGSSGTKPNAQVRAIDVGTNLVNDGVDTAVVLVNGGASEEQVPYGMPSHYLYVQAGGSTFQASTTEPEPTITYPTGTDNGNTAPVTVTVAPIINTINLASGGMYTAYLVGRPDVPNPQQIPVPPAVSPPDLDPRYVNVVVLGDTQAAPGAGQATVRVMSAVPDITSGSGSSAQVFPRPTLNVTISGAGNNATFSNVPFATQATGASTDQMLTGGTVTVAATATYSVSGGGTNTVTLPLTNNTVSIPAGGKYTLVITEPTDVTVNALAPTGVPQTISYGVQVVQD